MTPHMLRHTFGMQLVNAGCQITTIQALLGHKRINTTLTYARVHDRTVAEDYFAAMEMVEQRLVHQLPPPPGAEANRENGTTTSNAAIPHLLTLATTLQTAQLPDEQQAVVAALQAGLAALAQPATMNQT
ncbi:MAG: site-specific integrase [Ardenticatenaceae bacterium]|nr:site-specific integrase [Ardenticatenaceae bacterium]MCB9002912.1 site-specific integrase [Ardenticatenaceae bacterium]